MRQLLYWFRHHILFCCLFVLALLVVLSSYQTSAVSRQAVISHSDPLLTGIDRPLLAADVPTLKRAQQLYQAGQFAEAIKTLEQVTIQTQTDPSQQVVTLNLLSLSYQKLNQWEQAETAIAKSLSVIQASKSNLNNWQFLQAQALNTQGHLQLATGQTEAALATWKQATQAYQQAGDSAGVVGGLINQAQAQQGLGFYPQALATLTQVNQVLQTQPDSSLKVTGLRSLGNALRIAGDPFQSRQTLEQALTIARQLKDQVAIASTLLSLGNTVSSLQDIEAGLVFYQQAAATLPQSEIQIQAQLNYLNALANRPEEVIIPDFLPTLQQQIAQLPASRPGIYARLSFVPNLLKLAEKRQQSNQATPEARSKQLAQLVAVAVQQAQDLQDVRAQSQALGTLGNLYERNQQWSDAQDLTQQALFLAQSIKAADITYRWQWQAGRIFRATDNEKSALAAYAEAVETLKSLRSDLVAINPEVQFSFRDSVEPIYREYVSLLLAKQDSSNDSKTKQKELDQARAAIESLQLAELENFFRQACLEATPVQIDQVDQQAAVVYPIILPDRLEVILSLPNQPLTHYATKLTQFQVEEVVKGLRSELTDTSSTNFLGLSQQVYDWLIRPAEAKLTQSKITTLVFVLDGWLRNVPMTALHDGQEFLVEKYSVSLAPGLQLLDVKPLERQKLKVLTAGLSEARQGFSALPFVEDELEQIRAEFPAEVLLNQDFTLPALKEQIQAFPSPIVHLATHGEFSSQAENTFLLTWDSRIDINQLNILLGSRNDSRQRPIELLVLSACRTAIGDSRATLGLSGMAIRAGARSTIGTLWYVSDEAASSIMSDFYREFADTKISKAEALRRAQVKLLKNPNYRHPYYWSAFLLVGNWL